MLVPSTTCPLSGFTPAISRTVGYRSAPITGTSQVDPGFVTPGQRTISGTRTPTYGGYSNQYVIDEQYALKVSATGDLSGIAPLLCAGITTYSPLKKWGVGPGKKVAVAGLGGLGHMGVKLAVAMGADVTVISTSPSKEADARALGATGFVNVKDADSVAASTGKFDFLLDTISANHDYNAYLGMLTLNGVMVVVGVPTEPVPLHAFSLIGGNKVLAGSLIGGIPETERSRPGTLPWYGDEYALDDFIVYTSYGHKREHGPQIEAVLERTVTLP